MKTLLFISLLILGTLPVLAQRYVADTKQSKLTWTGYGEVGNYAPSGTIQLQQGTFDLTGTQLSSGRIVIDMRTLQHNDDKMQTHLRGEDFFNASTFPTATFVLQQIKGNLVSGQLTIKGVTKAVSFPITLTTADNALRIRGKATVDRTLFGIKYNSSSFFSGLGDYAIKNTFDLAFELVARPVLK